MNFSEIFPHAFSYFHAISKKTLANPVKNEYTVREEKQKLPLDPWKSLEFYGAQRSREKILDHLAQMQSVEPVVVALLG